MTNTLRGVSDTTLKPPPADLYEPELSIREIVRVVRDHKRVFAALLVGAPVLVVIIVLLTPRSYTATASFYPETRRGGTSALGGFAAQYGIAVPGMGGDAGQSLQFYVELARSREILTRLLADSVQVPSEGVEKRAIGDELKIKGGTPAERIENGVQVLRLKIRPVPNATTGIIRLAVTTHSPMLSQALAERTIDLINEFNLRKRQSQGASERQFAERRLAEMTDSLTAAENRLQLFEQRNVQYQTAPHLRMEHRRLMNNLAAKQTLHTAMAQTYEQARMEEVRDTPVITILEKPAVPVRPDSRRGAQKVLFSIVLALVAGLVYAFGRTHLARWSVAG